MATSKIEAKNYSISETIMGGNVLLRRIGRVCYMYIQAGSWTNTSTTKTVYSSVNGQNVYLSLPSGYRPADIQDFIISTVSGATNRMVIRTNGNVESVPVITNEGLRGSVTYLTNDAEI